MGNRRDRMKITEGQLRKIIREEIEILNADSGEVLTLDRLPPKYTGRLTKADGYDALYNSDFEALRRDLMLNPDEALGMLEDLAAEEMGAAGGDLGTAIDIAMGFKVSYPKEWKAALTSQRIKDMYYEDEAGEFKTISDALARFLAERMG
jgi:hypothetical protein